MIPNAAFAVLLVHAFVALEYAAWSLASLVG